MMDIKLSVTVDDDEKQIQWHFEGTDGWTLEWRDHDLVVVTDGGHEYFPARGRDEIQAIYDLLTLRKDAEAIEPA
jgi:hypothetical protein